MVLCQGSEWKGYQVFSITCEGWPESLPGCHRLPANALANNLLCSKTSPTARRPRLPVRWRTTTTRQCMCLNSHALHIIPSSFAVTAILPNSCQSCRRHQLLQQEERAGQTSQPGCSGLSNHAGNQHALGQQTSRCKDRSASMQRAIVPCWVRAAGRPPASSEPHWR